MKTRHNINAWRGAKGGLLEVAELEKPISRGDYLQIRFRRSRYKSEKKQDEFKFYINDLEGLILIRLLSETLVHRLARHNIRERR